MFRNICAFKIINFLSKNSEKEYFWDYDKN